MESRMTTRPMISYCSPLMNRHWQLEQTLAANLQCVAAFKGRVEWVITNIRRQDDLSGADWVASDALIRREGADLIERGWLRYHRTELSEWNPSAGKNLGKYYATGEFLINMDIDNRISIPDTCRLLKLDLGATIYHGFNGIWGSGTSGMVGVPRAVFYAIGGYNEELVGYGFDDIDFLMRAQRFSGMQVTQFCTRTTIPNSARERTENILSTNVSLEEQSASNKAASLARIQRGQLICKNRITGSCKVLDAVGRTVALQKD